MAEQPEVTVQRVPPRHTSVLHKTDGLNDRTNLGSMFSARWSVRFS
jgi:hypothetical protein